MRIQIFIFLHLLGFSKISLSQNCPQANAGSDVSFCSGIPVMLGTTATTGYQYSWNPIAGLSNPNIAQPIATPSSTTTYTLTVSPTNLISNGDFENGYTGFGTDYPAYPNTIDNIGTQLITTSPSNMYSGWCNMPDHSPNGTNMLAIDGAIFNTLNYRFWFTAITVEQNTNYVFSFWAATTSSYNSDLRLTLTGNNSGAIIQDINVTATFPACNMWQNFQVQWNSGNNTQLSLDMRFILPPLTWQYSNDLAIDDISFRKANCLVTTDQVVVCVCTPPPPPSTVTVQIPIQSNFNLTKQDPAFGHACNEPRNQTHSHYPLFNDCDESFLMSGFMLFDNNLASHQAFGVDFNMRPTTYPSNPTVTYLDFPLNNQNLYEPCLVNDIIDVKLKFFHKQAPFCGNVGWLNDLYITQPHSGNNPFSVKRLTQSFKSCGTINLTYSYDNFPPTAADIVNVGASGSAFTDYSITITQMVKNSLTTNSTYIGFLINQTQNSTYNNVLFDGILGFNGVVDLGEPYIELTYVRRPKSTGCGDNTRPINITTDTVTNSITDINNIPKVSMYKSVIYSAGKVKIAPNPANKQTTLSAEDNIKAIEIFSIAGVTLKKISVNKLKNIILNVQDLLPGLYYCRITTNSGVEYLKLLIQR